MIREEIILKYVKGKDVLDIGSVGIKAKYNLWNLIDKEAKSVQGIDTDASDDSRIVQGNMETYSFERQFDVIIAGDVIEHVDNQGAFLGNIRKHLADDGYLIITTPNAKWFTVMLKPLDSHMLWHDKYTLYQILERQGFEVILFRYYYGNKPYYNLIKRILAWRQSLLVIAQKKK